MKEKKVSCDEKEKKSIKRWWQKAKIKQDPIVDHSDSIHILINSIDCNIKEKNNCIVFTSYIEEQGKTYIIHKLGEGLAEANYKSLIIDCNIEKPMLNKKEIIEETEEVKGFLDFIELAQERTVMYDEVKNYIRRLENENLYFMPLRGIVQEDYKQYIRQEAIHSLLQILKEHFDVILIEAPSFQRLSYMQTIVSASDGYFMVIKAGTIAKNQINIIKEKMNQLTKQSIGVILNKSQDIYKGRDEDEAEQNI